MPGVPVLQRTRHGGQVQPLEAHCKVGVGEGQAQSGERHALREVQVEAHEVVDPEEPPVADVAPTHGHGADCAAQQQAQELEGPERAERQPDVGQEELLPAADGEE